MRRKKNEIFSDFVNYIFALKYVKIYIDNAANNLERSANSQGGEMYSIGDKIVYGTVGVMEIADITEQEIGGRSEKYYVLKEYGTSSSSLTYVPLDNVFLVSQMRELLSPEEIDGIIKAAKKEPLIDWIEDNRARSNEYKRILSEGDHIKILSMIKTVNDTGRKREEEGKRNYLADEAVMKKAERLISTEFSISLGIPETEVFDYIEKN